MTDHVFLVGFFRFHALGPERGFERIHLMGIFLTEEEAREQMFFDDECRWYMGALIEKRGLGNQDFQQERHRVWLYLDDDLQLVEIEEPEYFKHIINLI